MAVVGLTTCKLLTFKEKLVGVRRFELPAPASRRQLGVYKYLLLIGILEAPVDLGAQQLIPDLD